jgi:hypothetical protein
VAYAIWIAFFSRFVLSWVMPRRVWTIGSMRSVAGEDGAYVPFMLFMEGKE